MAQRILAVEYRPLASLRFDPQNPRLHNKKQIRQIARSIEAFGFNVPVLIDGRGQLIAGHGRMLAAQLLGMRQDSLYRSQHEFVFVFKSGKGADRNKIQLGQYGRYRTNVWDYRRVHSLSRSTEEGNLSDLHQTIKPVELVADAILDCTARGEIVLDPFLGSGTTVIAAERTGRACYGIELDPGYVDTIVRRWQAFTGLSVVHAKSGRTFHEMEEGAKHEQQG